MYDQVTTKFAVIYSQEFVANGQLCQSIFITLVIANCWLVILRCRFTATLGKELHHTLTPSAIKQKKSKQTNP